MSVLVSTKNNETTIGECLESLVRQTHDAREVVVVDDGSTDGTLARAQALAAEHPEVRIVSLEESAGVAGARNVAMQHAAGEVFAFVDADAFAEPEWLAELVRPLGDEGVGCTGGPDQVPADDPLISRCVGYSMHSLIGSGGVRGAGSPLARYWPAGCNMAVTREAVERIGGFDETMLPRGEEKDLQARLRAAGLRIAYVPSARVWHRRRTSIRAFWRQMYGSGIARAKLFRRHPRQAQAAQLAPAVGVAAAGLGAVAGLLVPPLGLLWLACAAAYVGLLVVDGLLAAARLRDARAILVVPLTSAIVFVGYGVGTLAGLLHRK